MLRVRRRWETPLGRWIGRYGVARLVRDFRVAGDPISPFTPYHWLSGHASPVAARAALLVRLAGGRLSLQDLRRHRDVVTRSR